jgi:hypothetical protein
MLPFLKKKQQKQVAAITQPVSLDYKLDEETQENEQESSVEELGELALEACAESLITAVNNKDTKAVSKSLKNAFKILEMMPHEEAEEQNEQKESYE